LEKQHAALRFGGERGVSVDDRPQRRKLYSPSMGRIR
jgi:hypothetical protein